MFKQIQTAANKLNLGGPKIPIVRTLLASSTLGTILGTNIVDLINPLNIPASSELLPLHMRVSLFSICGNDLSLAKLIAVAILLLSISGFLPRWSSVLQWWVSFSLSVSCMTVDGGDQINSILCLFLIPILIFDKRKNQWMESVFGTSNAYLNILFLSIFWVIRLQVSMIYFQAATAKLSVSEWTNGTASYYWLAHPIHGMPSWIAPILMPVLVSAFGVALITWGTLIFETILAMSLFMSENIRKYLFIPGILFHFGIVLVHGLSSFFLVMAAALLLLTVPFTKYDSKIEITEQKYA